MSPIAICPVCKEKQNYTFGISIQYCFCNKCELSFDYLEDKNVIMVEKVLKDLHICWEFKDDWMPQLCYYYGKPYFSTIAALPLNILLNITYNRKN